jgi:hypothetical protein
LLHPVIGMVRICRLASDHATDRNREQGSNSLLQYLPWYSHAEPIIVGFNVD